MNLKLINLSVMKPRPLHWVVFSVVLTVFVICLLTLRAVTSISLAETGVKQLKDGYFSLSAPLIISHHPLVRVERGKVKFLAASDVNTRAKISGVLPALWTEFFTAEKLEHLILEDANLVIDLRNSAANDGPLALPASVATSVAQALRKSSLENLIIQNSTLKILRDFNKPVVGFINSAKFDVDLAGSDIEGSGLITLQGEETRFSVDYNFAKKNAAGIVLGDVAFSLENRICSGDFKGVIEGRPQLHLSGEVNFKVADALSFRRWFAPLSEDAPKKTPGPKTIAKAKPFSLTGTVAIMGDESTLSLSDFQFGKSTATGNLALKLGQANPEISGTLAFQTLDIASIVSVGNSSLVGEPSFEKPHFNKMVAEKKKASAGKEPFKDELRQGMEQGARQIYALVQNLDVDLRLSAASIQLNDFEIKDTGFSVFQKQGEFIVDMAGMTMFNGQVTGLFKFDTNFPKPRWHINSNFTGVDFALISKTFGLPPFIEGAGDYRFHITSFGDKPDEIFANVSGAFTLEAPGGGHIAIQLSELLLEQKLGSGEQISQLKSGKSEFTTLLTKGHFAKGAVVADHFSVRTKAYEFTGAGALNLEAEKIDLHIGAWDISHFTTEQKEGREDVKSEQQGPQPLLLTCSQLKGAWGTPYFEKFTAAHLIAMKRVCPAKFRYVPLKTKDHPIVPLKDAG